jgi:hypothetical protein
MKITGKKRSKRPQASKSKARAYTYSCLEYCIPDEGAVNLKGDVNF